MPYSTILFDLDNTLYPASSQLLHHIGERIGVYIQNFLGVGEDEALRLRQRYSAEFGTTLSGLQAYHAVDIEEYLRYIHDITTETFLAVDVELDRLLGEVQGTKAIFTNSPLDHAQRVLKTLNIAQHFSHIFDLRFANFQPKPALAGYHLALDVLCVPASDVIFLEDTARNLAPARELGMTTILIGEEAEDVPLSADHVAPDILAALHVVLEYQAAR